MDILVSRAKIKQWSITEREATPAGASIFAVSVSTVPQGLKERRKSALASLDPSKLVVSRRR